MSLDSIVNVQITAQTQQVSQAGFGTLMILGVNKRFNDRIRYYASLAAVGEDFATTDKEYIAAQDVFSQVITPDLIAIGRRSCDSVTTNVLTAITGKTYTVTINGTAFPVLSTPTTENSTVVLDADLVSSNSIAVSLNGTTVTGSPFTYASSHLSTMTTIANAIASMPNIASATVGGANNRTITVIGDPNQNGVVNSFVVTLGASQATATITETLQDVSPALIASKICNAINAGTEPVTATDNEDGSFDVEADVALTPFTYSVSTNIIVPNTAQVEITQVVPLQSYTVTINGTQFVYTAGVNVQDNETIAAALVELINEDETVGVIATDNLDGTFRLATGSTTTFNLQVTSTVMAKSWGLIQEPLVASDTVENDLEAIQDVSDDWYALATTSRDSSTCEDIAEWIESQTKIFGSCSSDTNIINQAAGTDETSIAAIFNNLGYRRSFVIYHQDADSDYPECAWFGRVLPLTPGSETWMFKTLATISTSDLTTSQSLNALNKKCNTYQFIGGVGITQNGTVAAGEYIDIIRGIDWLQATMQEYVYSVLVNNAKIPYTDAGIAVVEAQVKRALDLGVSNGFLSDDPAPTTSVPKAKNVPSNDKSTRTLKNVNFEATLSGAIQTLQIRGNLSV